VNAVADEDVSNIPASKYTLKLVGSLEDAAATGDRGARSKIAHNAGHDR
jgi:hypothetical protein